MTLLNVTHFILGSFFFYKTLAVSLIVPSGFDGPATLIIVPKHQGG